MAMDSSQKAALIRKGNEFFNQGRMKEAIQLFMQADYKDGLARVGDHFLYERKEPLNALSFYQKAGYKKGIDLIIRNIVYTVRTFLGADKYTDNWNKYIDSNFDQPGEKKSARKQDTSENISPEPGEGKKVPELEALRKKLKEKED